MEFDTDLSLLEYAFVVLSLVGVICLIYFRKKTFTATETEDVNLVTDKILLLSNREKEVYDKLLEGKTNKSIADELFIEVSTVKSHVNNIYKTLEVKSRRELLNNSKTAQDELSQ